MHVSPLLTSHFLYNFACADLFESAISVSFPNLLTKSLCWLGLAMDLFELLPYLCLFGAMAIREATRLNEVMGRQVLKQELGLRRTRTHPPDLPPFPK